jgi:hypothetical protein
MLSINKIKIYPIVISAEGMVIRNFLQYIENIGTVPPKHLKSGAKSSTFTNVSYNA